MSAVTASAVVEFRGVEWDAHRSGAVSNGTRTEVKSKELAAGAPVIVSAIEAGQ